LFDHESEQRNCGCRSLSRQQPGRANFDEDSAVIVSLQLTDHPPGAPPVNWKAGEDCVVAAFDFHRRCPGEIPKGSHGESSPTCAPTPQPIAEPPLRQVSVGWTPSPCRGSGRFQECRLPPERSNDPRLVAMAGIPSSQPEQLCGDRSAVAGPS